MFMVWKPDRCHSQSTSFFKRSPEIYDGSRQTRCFTYIDDVIKGVFLAGTSVNAIGRLSLEINLRLRFMKLSTFVAAFPW